MTVTRAEALLSLTAGKLMSAERCCSSMALTVEMPHIKRKRLHANKRLSNSPPCRTSMLHVPKPGQGANKPVLLHWVCKRMKQGAKGILHMSEMC